MACVGDHWRESSRRKIFALSRRWTHKYSWSIPLIKKQKIDHLATTGIPRRSIIFELAYFEDGFHRPCSVFFFRYSLPLLPFPFLSPPLFSLSKRQHNYSSKQRIDRCSIDDRNCGTGGIGYLIIGLDTASLLMSKQMKRRRGVIGVFN